MHRKKRHVRRTTALPVHRLRECGLVGDLERASWSDCLGRPRCCRLDSSEIKEEPEARWNLFNQGIDSPTIDAPPLSTKARSVARPTSRPLARPRSLRAGPQDRATSPWTTVTAVRCPTDVTAGAGPQDRATSPWSTTVTAVRCPTDVTAGAGPQDGATSPWSTTVTALPDRRQDAGPQDGATSPWSTTVTAVRCPTDVTAGAGPQDGATSPWSTTVTTVRCPTDVTAGAGPQNRATSPWSTTVTAVRCPTNVTADAGWRDVTLVNHGDHSPLPDRSQGAGPPFTVAGRSAARTCKWMTLWMVLPR